MLKDFPLVLSKLPRDFYNFYDFYCLYKFLSVVKTLKTIINHFHSYWNDETFNFKRNSLRKSIEVHFNRSKIFLLYFYVNLWEKNCRRSTAYSCRTNAFTELHHFMKKKKNRHSWRLNNSSKTFLSQWGSMGFRKLTS